MPLKNWVIEVNKKINTMKNFISHTFSLRPFLSLGVLTLLTISLLSSCESEFEPLEPIEEILEPTSETYIYLVKHNDGEELKSLTITEFSDGTGTMIIPEIVGSQSTNAVLVIDRIDETRANIQATFEDSILPITSKGAGFFTPDSAYVEFIIEGFSNRDIFAGTR